MNNKESQNLVEKSQKFMFEHNIVWLQRTISCLTNPFPNNSKVSVQDESITMTILNVSVVFRNMKKLLTKIIQYKGGHDVALMIFSYAEGYRKFQRHFYFLFSKWNHIFWFINRHFWYFLIKICRKINSFSRYFNFHFKELMHER